MKSPTSPGTALSTRNPRHSNLPSRACRHNVNYWRGGSFYGLGPSATSYVRGVRTKNWSNTQLYCEQLEQGQRAVEVPRRAGAAGSRREKPPRSACAWWRAGRLSSSSRSPGYDLRREWADDMNQLVQQGWGRILPDRFHLTGRACASPMPPPSFSSADWPNPQPDWSSPPCHQASLARLQPPVPDLVAWRRRVAPLDFR